MMKYISRPVEQFLKSNCPELFSVIEFDAKKMGSEFDQEKGVLSVGIGRQEWIIHELGHIVFASYEELIQKDYGIPIAEKYNFKDIKNEMNVFRFHHVVFDYLGLKYSVEGSCRLITKQTVSSLIDKDRAKMKTLMLAMKSAFYDPIQDGELEMYMQELNQKIKYLKSLQKAPAKDLLIDDLFDSHENWDAA